jgi:hypothetical protein
MVLGFRGAKVGTMRQTLLWAWTGAVLLLAGGCSSVPPLDNPTFLRPDAGPAVENPVYIPLGPPAYNTVYEKTLDILVKYFEIKYENRYGGYIETYPRVEPGFERAIIAGSPGFCERLLATLQSVRHFAIVRIQVADDGGFWVDVKVYRELEDVPRPSHATAGAAVFRNDNTVERQFEVLEPSSGESNWIPIGEDVPLEQAILRQLKACL